MSLSFKAIDGRTAKISDAEVYVDNQSRGRSGHMSHALVRLGPGRIMAFNSNCSPKRLSGHAACGWNEYRISEDDGVTWGEVKVLDYSWQAYLDMAFTVSVEKAVRCGGRIVAFALRNTPYREICCEPWLTSVTLLSDDDGQTWREAGETTPFRGRIYDALECDGTIYLLQFCNDAEINFTGNRPEHLYRIYRSLDQGESFQEVAIVPFLTTFGRGYGSMLFLPDGSLIVYAYNLNDEVNMDYAVLAPDGTWTTGTSFVAKKIRNPQTAILDSLFVLHGRTGGGTGEFVFYTSRDGMVWDEGVIVAPKKPGCYYSNNIVVEHNGKKRLLVQYSDTYEKCCVNVMHRFLEIED